MQTLISWGSKIGERFSKMIKNWTTCRKKWVRISTGQMGFRSLWFKGVSSERNKAQISEFTGSALEEQRPKIELRLAVYCPEIFMVQHHMDGTGQQCSALLIFYIYPLFPSLN